MRTPGLVHPSEFFHSRGTSFPPNPYEGQPWFRTDLEEWFYRDKSRLKWLGFDRVNLGTFSEPSTTGVSNKTFFYGAGSPGAPGDARTGPEYAGMVQWDATVVGVSLTFGSTHSATIEIKHRDDSASSTSTAFSYVFVSSQRHNDTTRNYDVDVLDRLWPRVSGTITNRGGVNIYVRRRAS